MQHGSLIRSGRKRGSGCLAVPLGGQRALRKTNLSREGDRHCLPRWKLNHGCGACYWRRAVARKSELRPTPKVPRVLNPRRPRIAELHSYSCAEPSSSTLMPLTCRWAARGPIRANHIFISVKADYHPIG